MGGLRITEATLKLVLNHHEGKSANFYMGARDIWSVDLVRGSMLWRAWAPDETLCSGFKTHSETFKAICKFPPWIALNALEAMRHVLEKEHGMAPRDLRAVIEALKESMEPLRKRVKMCPDDKECACGAYIIWKDETKVSSDGRDVMPEFRAYGPNGRSVANIGVGGVSHALNAIMTFSQSQAREALRHFRDWLIEHHKRELVWVGPAIDEYLQYTDIVLWSPHDDEVPIDEEFNEIMPMINDWALNH